MIQFPLLQSDLQFCVSKSLKHWLSVVRKFRSRNSDSDGAQVRKNSAVTVSFRIECMFSYWK